MKSFVSVGETVSDRVGPLLDGLPPGGDAWGMSEPRSRPPSPLCGGPSTCWRRPRRSWWPSSWIAADSSPGGRGSVAGFLAGSCGMSSGEARRLVAVSEALGSMPETRALFETGEVSAAKVRVLAPAASAYPDLFAAHEPAFVDAAKTLTVGRLQQYVAMLVLSSAWLVRVARAQKGLGQPEAGEIHFGRHINSCDGLPRSSGGTNRGRRIRDRKRSR